MKLARVIRFDRSDLNIFPQAADEGEWAITGSFSFADLKEDEITGKIKQAFANGFMGVPSFGYSTLVSVATAKDSDVDALTDQLVERFMTAYGAPSVDLARAAAEEEINFIADICHEHKTGTLLSLTRTMTAEGIRESFRAIAKADSCSNQQLWTIVEDDAAEGDAHHGDDNLKDMMR